MQTNSKQPATPAEANDSRTANDEAVVCKELLGVTSSINRLRLQPATTFHQDSAAWTEGETQFV